MVQTAHFGGQTNLLVPGCFNLMHCNSIKIGRIDDSCVPGCILSGFALRPVEKPVRTYRLGHVNRSAKGRKTRHFCLVCGVAPFSKRIGSRLQIELYAPGRCALISQFLPVWDFLY
jgi:hypothetical protein